MKNEISVQILEGARELLQNVGWIQGDFNRDKNGHCQEYMEDINLSETEGFCLIGSIYYSAYNCNKYWVPETSFKKHTIGDTELTEGNPVRKVLRIIRAGVGMRPRFSIVFFNDNPKTTKENVLKVIDEAINNINNKNGRLNINRDNIKTWFGDSKVVDENGQPLVVYHGTNAIFNGFDKDKFEENTGVEGGDAFWFSPSEMFAGGYGKKLTKAYLKIEKLFDTANNKKHENIYKNWVKEQEDNNDQIETQGQAEDGFSDGDYEFYIRGYMGQWEIISKNGYPFWENNGWLSQKVKENGFDGFITSEGNGAIGIAVFEPEQICQID